MYSVRLFLSRSLQLRYLLGPNLVVQELSGEVENYSKAEAAEVEDNLHGPTEHLQYRVHPEAGVVVDDVHPHEVHHQEGGERGEAALYRGVLTEGQEHLQDDEHHDVCVHDVVEPRGEIGVQHLGEHELAVHGHEAPEGHAHVHGDGEGEGAEHKVLDAADSRCLGWHVLIGSCKVIQQRNGEVHSLQDLKQKTHILKIPLSTHHAPSVPGRSQPTNILFNRQKSKLNQ